MAEVTARAPITRDAESYVQPIDWLRFELPPPSDDNAVLVRSALLNATRYGVTTWWQERYADQAGRYLDLGGVSEAQIRSAASEGYAIAVALKTGSYDPAAFGVPVEHAFAIAIRLCTSVAHHHRATTRSGWGDAWQSALWAYYAGNAAWLLWDELAVDARRQVAAMLAYEADRFRAYEVPYYRDRDGTVIFPGDSKAEENAWNTNLLQLVTAMMPGHPHQEQWMAKNIELMISAFARPSDLDSPRILHGRPVREWLAGSNIADDGTLVNHGFIHPDYMATIAMNTSTPMTDALANNRSPEAARFNADVVYGALSTVNFAVPPYQSPGGTVYVHDGNGRPTADIYYPVGNDWGTRRLAHFVAADASAHLFGYDEMAAGSGADWERLHVRALLEMQARGTDGRTYQAPGEDTYAGREEWVAVEIARAYLAHWLDSQDTVKWTNVSYPDASVDDVAPESFP